MKDYELANKMKKKKASKSLASKVKKSPSKKSDTYKAPKVKMPRDIAPPKEVRSFRKEAAKMRLKKLVGQRGNLSDSDIKKFSKKKKTERQILEEKNNAFAIEGVEKMRYRNTKKETKRLERMFRNLGK